MSPDLRLIVHASSGAVKKWIDDEVADLITARQYPPTIHGVVEALRRGLASTDDLLIVDLDRLSVEQIAELRAGIETSWWRGTLVGLGRERHRHTSALTIAHAIPRPFGSEALRAIVTGGRQRDTQPILRVTH